jgi:hypothetical protein
MIYRNQHLRPLAYFGAISRPVLPKPRFMPQLPVPQPERRSESNPAHFLPLFRHPQVFYGFENP